MATLKQTLSQALASVALAMVAAVPINAAADATNSQLQPARCVSFNTANNVWTFMTYAGTPYSGKQVSGPTTPETFIGAIEDDGQGVFRYYWDFRDGRYHNITGYKS